MPQLFNDVGSMLLKYKNANDLVRQAMLLDTIATVQNLSGKVTSKEEAKKHYKELAYAATLINYADVLKRMENQRFFDIQFTFSKMELDLELQEWFEFNSSGQMRLKKPVSEYTSDIWEKFRSTQKAHLKKEGREATYDLDQLDIHHPPENQLYPIQIQMLGKLFNEAVDRISINTKGQIRFAAHRGLYQLPGGGMVEINNPANSFDLVLKMLEEHLEEEHANLHIKAATLYDQLDKDEFNTHLLEVLDTEAQAVPELQKALKIIAESEDANSVRLHKIVKAIDEQKDIKDAQVKKSLNTLRALVQVRTFALTSLFFEAFEYIKVNTKRVDIQQYLDTRAAGGFQMSHVFIMAHPLEEWFKEKFQGAESEFGDDIRGSKIERLTLLEGLTQFRKIKFSHLLIGLAAYNEALDNNALQIEHVWSEEQFDVTRKALISEACKLMKPGRELLNDAWEQFKATLTDVPVAKQTVIITYINQLNNDLSSAENQEQKEVILNKFTNDCIEILEEKDSAALKRVLTIVAVVVAATLVGTIGFWIGFALGLWTGPGAFVTAVTGACGAALGVVAAVGVSECTGALTSLGLFRENKGLTGVEQFVHTFTEVIEPTIQIEDQAKSMII